MNDEISTIRIEKDTKQDFVLLQRKHRYKNATMLISDMVFFFNSNDISPRQKDSIQKQVALFRDSLFKKIGALERDYFKPHYQDFNQVSGFIKEQFDQTKKMVADFGGSRAPKKGTIDTPETDAYNVVEPLGVSEKKIEAIEYLLNNFEKKCEKQGGKIVVDEERYTQLRLGLMNVLNRD